MKLGQARQARSNSFGSQCKIPRCRTANNTKCATYSTYGFVLRLFFRLLRVGKFSDLLARPLKLGQTRSNAVKLGQTRSNAVKRGQARSNSFKLGQTRKARSNSFGSQCKIPRCRTANNVKCANYSIYGFLLRLFLPLTVNLYFCWMKSPCERLTGHP